MTYPWTLPLKRMLALVARKQLLPPLSRSGVRSWLGASKSLAWAAWLLPPNLTVLPPPPASARQATALWLGQVKFLALRPVCQTSAELAVQTRMMSCRQTGGLWRAGTGELLDIRTCC